MFGEVSRRFELVLLHMSDQRYRLKFIDIYRVALSGKSRYEDEYPYLSRERYHDSKVFDLQEEEPYASRNESDIFQRIDKKIELIEEGCSREDELRSLAAFEKGCDEARRGLEEIKKSHREKRGRVQYTPSVPQTLDAKSAHLFYQND